MVTLHAVIADQRTRILEAWTAGVRGSAFAKGLTEGEVLSVVPQYLALLGRRSGADVHELTPEQQALIESHLSNRMRQGATQGEILTDFAILARAVHACLPPVEDGHRPAAREVASLFVELSVTCTAAVKIFTEHMLEDEQAEKRFARLLHDSVAASRGMSLPALATRALQVIAGATGAESVSLRVFDTARDQQILAVGVGDAAPALEEQSAHRLASVVQSAQPAVSERSKLAGIGRVLAVGLTSRDALRGDLHVGAPVARRFAASEVRRLQSLGDALMIHLDHELHVAALRERAASVSADAELWEHGVAQRMHDISSALAAAKAAAADLCAAHPGRELNPSRLLEQLARVEEQVHALDDVHRIRAGDPLPMTITECDLAALVRSAIDDLRRIHGDRFVLRTHGAAQGMWCAEQLKRAIFNLLANAAIHGARRTTIDIQVNARAEGVELSVHNAGRAISPGDQAQLGNPFSLHRPIGVTTHGWGLGLALVWGCAEAHGGHVELFSRPGKGTTFKLLLPSDARPYLDLDSG